MWVSKSRGVTRSLSAIQMGTGLLAHVRPHSFKHCCPQTGAIASKAQADAAVLFRSRSESSFIA